MDKSLVLSRLLQLSSPMLPVGAYCYSQGLEWAIECGDVHDKASAQAWIHDSLCLYQQHYELPILYRLYQACMSGDIAQVISWNAIYLAGRDTAEGLAETKQMGYSLSRLLHELPDLPSALLSQLDQVPHPAFPTVYAAIAQHWQIEPNHALHGYAWGWMENQVSAAMKTIPLGQVAGQTILMTLGSHLAEVVQSAMQLEDDELSNFNPLLSIAGCQHETQYSRLFRS